MSNSDKLEIIQRMAKLILSRSLINNREGDNDVNSSLGCVNYLADMREIRAYSIEPAKKADYLWPYYAENVLVFPTPPYDDDFGESFRAKASRFIAETRNVLAEFLAKKPENPVLDLRGNTGGYVYVFVDALLPILLPEKYVSKSGFDLLYGVDKYGGIMMKLSIFSGELQLSVDGNTVNDTLSNVEKYWDGPRFTVWVNSRTASSAEIIALICRQFGSQIVCRGENTMGLTTGMITKNYEGFNVSMPCYWFKDILGNVYRDGILHPVKNPKYEKKGKTAPTLYSKQILASLSEADMAKVGRDMSCYHNHLGDVYFDNNYHFNIHYYDKNPRIECIANDQCIYLYIPPKTPDTVGSILDKYDLDVLGRKKVYIDIRNSRLKGPECLELFGQLFHPSKVQLLHSSISSDEIGKYMYISAQTPYITTSTTASIGKYSGINAEILINRNSFHGDTYSTVLGLYLGKNYTVMGQFGPYPEYSLYTYVMDGFKLEVYCNHLR